MQSMSSVSAESTVSLEDRLPTTLERLLEVPAADLNVALTHATNAVAEALRADKVDAFLYVAEKDTLVALGSSTQPLSAKQRRLGLDVLPITNGGRVVHTFQTGHSHLTGDLKRDDLELRGPREALGIRSQISVALEVGGERRGVLLIASQTPDHFGNGDLRFAESVSRWVGIIAHRAELVDEIARNAAEQGRRAVAEELITMLAHDLRNHLSPIQLRVELVRRRAQRDGREHEAGELGLAVRGLQRLSSQIADVLDVARLDHGVFQIDIAPVDLVPLLEEAAATIADPSHGVRLAPSEEIAVAADARRVRQCVDNLLSNAIKHSPAHGTVTILVERARAADGKEVARIEVIDEGPGIAPDILPRLFERFVTGGRRGDGLGLGLYVARQIALLQGGDLTASAGPEQGARFVLTIPVWTDR